jgi:hypothetical protein
MDQVIHRRSLSAVQADLVSIRVHPGSNGYVSQVGVFARPETRRDLGGKAANYFEETARERSGPRVLSIVSPRGYPYPGKYPLSQ